MNEIEGVEKLLTILPSKRFGKHRCYGRGMYGFSDYGADEIVIPNIHKTGIEFSGIYRHDNVTGEIKHYREPYYTPYNPRTETQQSNRQLLADAVVAWQALTPAEKEVYNKNAKGKHMSGYNLFLREYLLSH